MTLYCVDDQLQVATSDTCGIFQLYFYKSLFDPLEDSEIIKHTKLTKDTVKRILNEIFSRNINFTEKLMEGFKEEYSM